MHALAVISGLLLDAFLASLVWLPKLGAEAAFRKITGKDPLPVAFLISLLTLNLSMQLVWPLRYTEFGWSGFWVLTALGMVAWDFRRIFRMVLAQRRAEGERTGGPLP